MNETQITTVAEIALFLNGTRSVSFNATVATECYEAIASALLRFNYFKVGKKDKSQVRQYLLKITGYSRQQLTRLIQRYRTERTLKRRVYQRHCFENYYTRADVLLLVETDIAHQLLSGPATKKLFERAYQVFGDEAYQRLAGISVGHLYNLRKGVLYREKRSVFTKTQRTAVAIAERKKPRPEGQPGFIRVDTVHQGDRDGVKGVYHINMVDEVTQMEVVFSAEKISESYLLPVLEEMLEAFPFILKNIHADNGSEYINHHVAKLLEKLLVEFTKSRSRHTNDNALAEGKNGAIIRKNMGYEHIPQHHAAALNGFYRDYFNPYINFHRPCFFPVITVDKKGKEKKTYPYAQIMTPYEKLRSLKDAEGFLKPEFTLEKLDKIAYSMTDLEAAQRMREAQKKLYKKIFDEKKSR